MNDGEVFSLLSSQMQTNLPSMIRGNQNLLEGYKHLEISNQESDDIKGTLTLMFILLYVQETVVDLELLHQDGKLNDDQYSERFESTKEYQGIFMTTFFKGLASLQLLTPISHEESNDTQLGNRTFCFAWYLAQVTNDFTGELPTNAPSNGGKNWADLILADLGIPTNFSALVTGTSKRNDKFEAGLAFLENAILSMDGYNVFRSFQLGQGFVDTLDEFSSYVKDDGFRKKYIAKNRELISSKPALLMNSLVGEAHLSYEFTKGWASMFADAWTLRPDIPQRVEAKKAQLSDECAKLK
jgi:hypothetical protein